jgi:peptidoglycan lytic transglycosylase
MTRQTGLTAVLVLMSGLAGGTAAAQTPQQFSGRAAYYSKGYTGTVTAGGRYDPNKFTAAHRTLPFGTRLLVTDPKSHRSVVVVVNDRGPFNKGLVIDLSLAAAKALHMTGRGVLNVTVTVQ